VRGRGKIKWGRLSLGMNDGATSISDHESEDYHQDHGAYEESHALPPPETPPGTPPDYLV